MAFAEWGTNKLIDPDTKRYMTVTGLADKLGMVRKHVTYSLVWLEEQGFVRTLPQDDGSKQIMVNAQLMWYGKEMLNIDEQFKAFNPVDAKTGEYVPIYKPEYPVVYKERKKKGEKKNGK
jgi:DNA-binding IclR family transcriptional regulator